MNPGDKVTPEYAKHLQNTNHPAGAWFNADGSPRNSITCVVCAEQVDCDDDFAVREHMRKHLDSLADLRTTSITGALKSLEPAGSFRRGIIVGFGVATATYSAIVGLIAAVGAIALIR